MNKYELALVVSAKIDDDARTAVVDKAKAIIEKAMYRQTGEYH